MRNPLHTRTAKSATTKRSLTLLGVLAALAAVVAYAVAATRAPAVPAPTIVSGPSGTTRATSASFAFSGVRGVTFECALDGAAFRACTSPKAYAGLAAGGHVFAVRARNASGQTSAPAERSWTVDLSAPAIAVWFPDDDGIYGADPWASACGGAHLCGSATDPSGVASVSLSIRRTATGLWWNGSAFASARELFLTASGTGTWRLSLPLPPEGAYAVRVRAVDGLGNATAPGAERTASFTIDRTPPPAPQIVDGPPSLTSSADAAFAFADAEAGVQFVCKLDYERDWRLCDAHETLRRVRDGQRTLSVRALDRADNLSAPVQWTWRVDTVAPPRPRITQKPSDPSSSTSATFAFVDQERGVTFECRLDRGAWSACASPQDYTGLAAARHRFSVRALDAAGNRSDTADWEWTVNAPAGGLPFTIGGSLAGSGLLVPGRTLALALRVSNPNDEPILVTSLTATLLPGSSKPGCDGPANLSLTQSNVSDANPLSVPAHGSVTLPAGGVSAPQVQMLNLPTNQDACKGAAFSFTFAGSAHS